MSDADLPFKVLKDLAHLQRFCELTDCLAAANREHPAIEKELLRAAEATRWLLEIVSDDAMQAGFTAEWQLPLATAHNYLSVPVRACYFEMLRSCLTQFKNWAIGEKFVRRLPERPATKNDTLDAVYGITELLMPGWFRKFRDRVLGVGLGLRPTLTAENITEFSSSLQESIGRYEISAYDTTRRRSSMQLEDQRRADLLASIQIAREKLLEQLGYPTQAVVPGHYVRPAGNGGIAVRSPRLNRPVLDNFDLRILRALSTTQGTMTIGEITDFDDRQSQANGERPFDEKTCRTHVNRLIDVGYCARKSPKSKSGVAITDVGRGRLTA